MTAARGLFVSFEGTEGVGKTTLIHRLSQLLQEQGQSVRLTREPGGTPLAEQIRQLLLTPQQEPMCTETELLLLYAARAQHLAQVIRPALAAGECILCDRFVDATLAYQHWGRGLSRDLIQLLNDQVVNVWPQLTFWLDAPVAIGMARARQRAELDRFEQEKLEFFERVRHGYATLHQEQPQRIIRLDATLPPEQVLEQASKQLFHRLSGEAI